MKKLTIPIILMKRIAKRNTFATMVVLIFFTFFISSLFANNKVPPIKVTSSYDCAPPASLATIRPVSSGLWNSPSTWPNGILPKTNDDVVVPPGIDLKMVGTCRARNITVQGKLSAVNWQPGGAWIDLEARSIMIANGGYMEIGTENQPYHAEKNANGISCQITLTGAKINNAPASYKAIMVMGGGRLEMHGKKRMSWTNLVTTANAGATQITLKEAVDWEVGDKIALTATGLASSQSKAWNDVDEAEITAISGNRRTLTLASPLKFKHIGGSKTYTRDRDGKTWNVNIQGEVGLLSHYIKIQGKMDGNNEQTGFGGHIMLMKNSIAHAENVELYKMGQKGVLGRYPFHWHLNEDKAQGSYFKNSSVHKSFNRAVTIHGTDYVTVDGIFAYDQIGHGIFLEDGAERFNTIKNNVVFVTRRPKPGEQLTPSDNEANEPQNRTPASYWITNPNNYFENNIAAGTEGTGFWFAFPERPMFDSGNLAYYQGLNPSKEPLGRFDGFVAHTCMTGWDVFDRLNPNHSLKKNFGWDVNTRQLIKDGLLYGNDQALYSGLGVGGTNENTVFYNCAFSDNKTVSMLAGDLTIENSLFNVDTDLGVFNGVREFFRFYDGPGRHIDCHFEGWNRSNAEMIKQITGGGATENFNPTFRGTTKGFSESFPFRFFPLPNTDNTRARKVGQFFKDYDGGLTGKAHTTLIRDIAFLRDGHEYRHPSWRNAARSDYYFAGLWLAGINSSGTRISVVRSKPGTEDVCFYESGSASSGTYKFPTIVNEGFRYTYYLDRAPSNKSIHLIWNRGDAGDLGFVVFKGLGKLGNFRARGHNFNLPRLNSIAAVENATDNAYFIAGNGDVYLKLRNLGGDDRSNIFFNWDNNGSFQPTSLPCTTNDLDGVTALDSDGDGRPDIVETDNCGNPNNASDLNFGFNRTSESFQKVNIAADNTSSDQHWLLRADNSNDPYVIRSGLKFNGSQVPQLRIRTKSEAAGTFQLFWATTDQPGFAANRSVTVAPQTTNVFEELVFDMSNLNTWMGKTITKIRLDFPPDASAPRHTWIDYIHGPNASDDPCDNTPDIAFTSPTNTQLEAGDNVGVVVSVTSGSVANIRLYLNNALVRQENAAPYEWGTANPGANDTDLLNLAAGTYELKAVATSSNGTSTTETKIITVINLTCNVIPYININNAGWQSTDVANANEGDTVWFGPQSEEFGSTSNGWSWTGPNNFTYNERGLLLSNLQLNQAGTYTATNIDVNGCEASKSFTLNISAVANGITIPGNFEAEAFTDISGSVRTENTPGGGQNLGFILNSNYTEYQIDVEETSTYDVTAYASSNTSGGTIEIYANNSLKGSIQIPGNGNWHSYQPYSTSISLSEGNQTLRLVYSGGATYLFNFDRMEITKPARIERTTSLSAIHDAYLDNSTRFNNAMVRLESGRRTGYLMFDTSDINGEITNATLEFQVFGDAGNGEVLVSEATHNGWTETNLSTQNRPAAKSQIIGSMSGDYFIGATIRIPVDLSKASSNKLSLILEMSGGNDFAFGSKENQTTGAPKLIIDYLENKKPDNKLNRPKLYPNPVKDIVRIVSGDFPKIVKVYDLLGAIKISKSLGENETEIDFSELSNGIYMVRIIDINNRRLEPMIYKIVKTN
ncbi:carbohydrate-binding protein [uncultured Aquimarina sp.]|uniref:carbohydrate-binding protein n=1 Tax=uncultured Aquimarina sp. TaxID=575652 RepID=UPI0026329A43|nr:carbohydrate-binding protein [uncultured Aquimarina sp.]